jgi:hypothetical protein
MRSSSSRVVSIMRYISNRSASLRPTSAPNPVVFVVGLRARAGGLDLTGALLTIRS